MPSREKIAPEEAERGAIEEIWHSAEQAANAVWQNYTLQDLCDRISARRQLDYMYYILTAQPNESGREAASVYVTLDRELPTPFSSKYLSRHTVESRAGQRNSKPS